MHAVGIARWVFLNKVHLNFNRAWRAWRALGVMAPGSPLQHLLLSKSRSQSVLASTTRVVTKMPMDLAFGGAVDLAVLEWEVVTESRAIAKPTCPNDNG
jgi:hypothetical protein